VAPGSGGAPGVPWLPVATTGRAAPMFDRPVMLAPGAPAPGPPGRRASLRIRTQIVVCAPWKSRTSAARVLVKYPG